MSSISHTIAAVLLVPIAERIGDSMSEPHPRLLIMVSSMYPHTSELTYRLPH